MPQLRLEEFCILFLHNTDLIKSAENPYGFLEIPARFELAVRFPCEINSLVPSTTRPQYHCEQFTSYSGQVSHSIFKETLGALDPLFSIIIPRFFVLYTNFRDLFQQFHFSCAMIHEALASYYHGTLREGILHEVWPSGSELNRRHHGFHPCALPN